MFQFYDILLPVVC